MSFEAFKNPSSGQESADNDKKERTDAASESPGVGSRSKEYVDLDPSAPRGVSKLSENLRNEDIDSISKMKQKDQEA